VVGSPAAVRAADAFVAHHRAHASAFAALAGIDAVAAAPPSVVQVLASPTPLLSERDGLTFLHTLESTLAATQQYVVGGLVTVPAIALTAATLLVECQHAAVFADLLSLALPDVAPAFQGTAGHLTPS
jgi:hypothetical protein